MKYIVELNPLMHIDYYNAEAETPELAIEYAKNSAHRVDSGDLNFSHWEVINVYLADDQADIPQ